MPWRGAPRRPPASSGTRHRHPSPTPRCRLDPERWRIQAALTEIAYEGRVGAVVTRAPWATRRRRAAVSASWREGTAGRGLHLPSRPAAIVE